MWTIVAHTPELANGIEYWEDKKGKEALVEFAIRAMYFYNTRMTLAMSRGDSDPNPMRCGNIDYCKARILEDTRGVILRPGHLTPLLKHIGYLYGHRASITIPTFIRSRYHRNG